MSKIILTRTFAIGLVVLFFLPLVSCESLTGFDDGWSGLDIGIGINDAEQNLFIFILLLLPIVLLIMAQNFMVSKIVSIAGVIAMIIFMLIVRIEYEGMLKMTIFSYLTLGLYILSVFFNFFVNKKKEIEKKD
jgi:hypothetical protein